MMRSITRLFQQARSTPAVEARDVDREFHDIVAQGDRFRDARDWKEAERHYRLAVGLKPESDIAIQLAHCLKEMGQFSEAFTFYRSIEERRPTDDDLQLQMGHLKKLWGDSQAALHYYYAAITLNPSNENARNEIMAMQGAQRDAAPDTSTQNFEPSIPQVVEPLSSSQTSEPGTLTMTIVTQSHGAPQKDLKAGTDFSRRVAALKRALDGPK